MVPYQVHLNLSKEQFGGEPVSHEKMKPLEMVAKGQDQSLSDRKQPWYHIFAFFLVVS